MTLLERIPPQALDAEQAVLGAMILERAAIVAVVDSLAPADFYSPQHGLLYAAIVDLYGENRPVDLVTVLERLRDRDQLESVGGETYLLELQTGGTTAVLAEQYAALVKDKATLRALIRAGGEIQAIGQEAADQDVRLVVAQAQKLLQAVDGRADMEGFLRWRDVLGQTISELETQLDAERHTLGISSGIRRLDDTISGWQRGTYYLVAARPSVGKTAFALAQCGQAASVGSRVAMFSLEMTAQAMARRHLARSLEIDLAALTNARFDRDRMDDVVRVSAQTQDWQLYVCQRSDLRIGQLRAEARQLARKIGGLDFIAVDYIQLIAPDARGRSRNDEITEISGGLKAMCLELDCSVVALSQLSRDSEKERRLPRLSDLRDSGSLEQDADVVIFLSWPTWLTDFQIEGRPNKNLRRVDVAKQRNGPARWFDVSWSGAYQRFADLERDRDGEQWWTND